MPGTFSLSKHVAEDLEEYEQWRPLLHDLGDCEVKHGVRVSVVNLYADQIGNAHAAEKVSSPEEAQQRVCAGRPSPRHCLALAAIVAGIA